MANEKKPSIYQDRGTIGSVKELDEYGVWVKSEPQILSTGKAGGEADDFSLDSLDDLPDFSTGLDSGAGEDASGEAGSPEEAGTGSAPGDEDFSIPDDDFNLDDFDLSSPEGDLGGDDDTGDLSGASFSIEEEAAPGDEGEGTADLDLSLPEEELGQGGDLDLSLPEGELEQGGDLDLSLLEEEPGQEADLDLSLPEEELGQEADLDLSLPEEEPVSPAEEAGGSDGDEGFDEISLEDLLGDVADEMPGEAGEGEAPAEELAEDLSGAAEDAPPAEAPRGSSGTDMSTQLLMKIADELSSIRTELSALKQEFTTVRGGGEQAESRGFFEDTGDDDKIALTGDELNNILNTADFTEETGQDATGGDQGGDGGPGAEDAGSAPPEAAESPAEGGPEEPEAQGEEVPEDLAGDLSGIDLGGELELPGEFEGEPEGLEALPDEAVQLDESGLAEPGALEIEGLEPEAFDIEGLETGESETGGEPDAGALETDLLSGEDSDQAVLDDVGGDELSLVDLSDDQFTVDFSVPDGQDGTGEAEESPAKPDGEDLLTEGVEITLEDQEEAPADDSGPDISLDNPFTEEESIALEDFDETALDLTGAVIEEPNLGAEIQENPPLEPAPADIAELEDSLGETGESLLLEESPLEESQEPGLLEDIGDLDAVETAGITEEPSLEIMDEPGPADSSLESTLEDLSLLEEDAGDSAAVASPEAAPSPLDEIEDEAEISRAEESAAEIPAVRGNIARGEDLDQIIPEGFVVEDADDEGEADFGGAGLDTLDAGVSLDEIPEDILPEEDEPPPVRNETPEEPGVSGLPGNFKRELTQVLSYMDQLLESLPEEKIEEFAKSEYFDTYKKLFKELGLA